MGESESQAEDKIIKVILDGAEYVVHIGAKTVAKTAAIALALGRLALESRHSKGKQSLKTMLKSGKELEIFSVAPEDLKEFAKEAKRYGITFCAVKNKKDKNAPVDILVKAEDAGRVNRIIERLNLGQVKENSKETENPTRGRSDPIKNREAQSSPFFEEDRPSVVDKLKNLAAERKQKQAPHRTRHRTKDRAL